MPRTKLRSEQGEELTEWVGAKVTGAEKAFVYRFGNGAANLRKLIREAMQREHVTPIQQKEAR